jgi:hypothetical protein
MPEKPYQRIPDGTRLHFAGMNLVRPPDQMPANKYPFAQNVRAYMIEGITGRATQDSSLFSLPSGVHSLRRLNDLTPAGPAGGYILVAGASNLLYANTTLVDSGLSGNPISLVPFRPNTSVQPWMYVGDSLKMDKVRSDGARFKMGIQEPQVAPNIAAVAASLNLSLLGPVTVTYVNNPPFTHNTSQSNFVWRNINDPSGSGPVWGSPVWTALTSGVVTGSSLLFDSPIPSPPPGYGTNGQPMFWIIYLSLTGFCNTAGTAVTAVLGSSFTGIEAGQTITIGSGLYTVASVNSSSSLTLLQSAGAQTDVAFVAVAQQGAKAVFQPQMESEGYSDFSLVVEATLYVPYPGKYTITVNSKDEFIWGIGPGVAGQPTWPGPTSSAYPPPPPPATVLAIVGQTITAKNGYPLIPKMVTLTGGGQNDSASTVVTFPAAGNYPIEIDYDYWYHSGRTLYIQQIAGNGMTYNILPISGNTITGAQYRYVYRSSITGATSNPSPPSAEQTVSVLSNTISATQSTDPQVDKIDFYRIDSALTAYTYVGTGPNSNTPFSDTVLDAAIVANPTLAFDNFEPFPSIDLPRSGTVNVGANGQLTWASGDRFNIRWLPGTIVTVGTSNVAPGTVNQGTQFTLYNRPSDSQHMIVSTQELIGGVITQIFPPQGTGLFYFITQPFLAAQPLPYLWGPTDNVSFFFACGDPLRPGTLYWCKGNNPDSAPETNQQDVTSPSEPLQNGCIVDGIGMVFSTERAWLIFPNFFNALSTVSGTQGSTWTLQESISDRGLYIPRCLAVDGGKDVYFRTKDGISLSRGGQGARSLTDEDLFNLFPHEGFTPVTIARGPYIVYPPDDTQPQLHKMNVANGYVYYDYVANINGVSTPQTLVYDIAARGWVLDLYQYACILHILEEGPNINQTLTGNADGSVRPLTRTGAETGCAILLAGAFNAGDTRAQKHFGDIYIEVDSSF